MSYRKKTRINADDVSLKTIAQPKLKIITQVGTVITPVAGSAYKSFPVAFGTTPEVMFTPVGTTMHCGLVRRPALGSFAHWGSPSSKILRWMARGSAA